MTIDVCELSRGTRRTIRVIALTIIVALMTPIVAAAQRNARDIGARLLQQPTVRAALAAARTDEARILDDQVRLCEIAAPPFKESARAKVFADAFRLLGLMNVRIDREGNVLGERAGAGPRPHLVLSAHLDTVFPAETNVKVTRQGTILRGPGIGDDCRGLAVLLGVARALNAANVQTVGTITFVGTVGEEGLGDLRGVKALFDDTPKAVIDRFVSIDGPGVGISNVGVGSRRYRVTFRGPGGHSYGNFGSANPAHALGRAISAIAEFQVPVQPRTTFSVGRLGGGVSVNAIPSEAWLEIDLRSTDDAALKALDARFQRAVERALAEENGRWSNRGRLSLIKERVGDRPAGRTADSAPIVEAAVSVTKVLDLPVSLDEASTDANIPMSRGIPAIRIEGGGQGSGAHAADESFDSTDSTLGTQRATLLAIALTEM